MILDSCFLIDVMQADEAAVAKLGELAEDPRPVAVTTPSLSEVKRGMSDAKRREFEAVIDGFSTVPFDRRAANTAADILRSLDDRGEPISAVDAMVAACALERDDPVVTRNVTEFRRVDRLSVTPY